MQTIESQVLLSQSKLWEILKEMYAKEALNAWQGVGTPFYLTSTPLLAHQWAQIAFDFFREIHEKGLDENETWNILEFGAGAGRFAYLFLIRFDQLHRRYFESLNSKPQPWRYVMLDISRPLFDFWQQHAYLEAFWQQGHLDYGFCDLSQDHSIRLELSGQILDTAALKIPCVAMGGYLFDTLQAEAFVRSNSAIAPLKWTLQVPQESIAKGVSSFVNDMHYQWQECAVDTSHALTKHPKISDLWKQYETLLEPGQAFTVSSGAISSLERVRRICPSGVLFLAADQGFGDIEELKMQPSIELGRHGSASCPVNYDAIARLLELDGHRVILSRVSAHKFVQMAAFLDGAGQACHTFNIVYDILNEFDNENYWRLFDEVIQLRPFKPSTYYLLLKLGKWDPVNFFHLLEPMQDHWDKLSSLERSRWLYAIERVAIYFYPIADGDVDLIHQLACLSVKLGNWKLAACIWSQACRFRPKRADMHFNLGLALFQLGQHSNAMESFLIAQTLDPSYSLEARGLI